MSWYTFIMTIKYKVFWSCFTAGTILGFGGYATSLPAGIYLMLLGIVLFVFSLSVLFFADRKSKTAKEVVLDGLFWMFIS